MQKDMAQGFLDGSLQKAFSARNLEPTPLMWDNARTAILKKAHETMKQRRRCMKKLGVQHLLHLATLSPTSLHALKVLVVWELKLAGPGPFQKELKFNRIWACAALS